MLIFIAVLFIAVLTQLGPRPVKILRGVYARACVSSACARDCVHVPVCMFTLSHLMTCLLTHVKLHTELIEANFAFFTVHIRKQQSK